MSITTTEQWLLIILASALAVFLILGIIALIKIIKLLGQMKQIATHAEAVAENVEQTAAMFSKAAGPLAFFKAFSNMADFVNTKRAKSRKED